MEENSNHSGQSTGELIEKIDSLLHNNRSALSAEAVHLLEEARDELKRDHSGSPTGEESSLSRSRALDLLFRFFAKPETLDRFEEWIDRISDCF